MIAHLDLDAFFAAVEELEHPELRGKPLVVGGDPKGRGVVATANYEARKYGIRSAMSAAEALRRCPDAVFVRPSKGLYGEYSRRVWDLVRSLVPLVEQVGADEGYLDLAVDDPDVARGVAAWVQREVRRQTTLSSSLGVATNKVVAKVASDRDKPGGLVVVAPGEEAAFLAPFPTRLLPGIGPKGEARLLAAGVKTIGELAALSDEALAEVWRGKVGPLLRERARGVDPRPLGAERANVSYSVEETFATDIADRTRLDEELASMSDALAKRLREQGQLARTVTVKLRYPDFTTRTRAKTRAKTQAPTAEAADLLALARLLLDGALAERAAPLRLIGLRVSGLVDKEAQGPEGPA